MTARTGVVLLGFGEPEGDDPEGVEGFLERIFLANAGLESSVPGGVEARAKALARARAPGLMEVYRSIGGSPLMAQLAAKRQALEEALEQRGHAIPVTVGTQFERPSIPDAVEWARENGIERLLALPTYPVCGPSTTLAALDEVAREVSARDDFAEVVSVSGWHRHAGFIELWADAIRAYVEATGISLSEGDTLLYFSAHGTPLEYLDRVPYDRYVSALCGSIAAKLGVGQHALGYQNHGNRPIPWVEPSNDNLLPTVEAARVVVVPISFIQEQSETLSELDGDVAGLARDHGIDFHRVPVPHDAPALVDVLADLVERALAPEAGEPLRNCSCSPGAWCTNGDVHGG